MPAERGCKALIDADERVLVVIADDVNLEELMGLWSKKGRATRGCEKGGEIRADRGFCRI